MTKPKPPKHKVRLVKFTPEEMAYDGPTPAELRKWKVVGRGKDAIFGKPKAGARVGATVTLDPDVAKVFASADDVNDALRSLIRVAKQSTQAARGRKQSA